MTVLACCALWAARAQDASLSMIASRDQMRAAYERMPRAELERVFLRCDAASAQQPLGFGDGVLCAMAWDALLRDGFGGDVQALLAWWRERRERPTRP